MEGKEAQTTIQLQKLLKELEQAHHVFLTQTGFSAVALSNYECVSTWR